MAPRTERGPALGLRAPLTRCPPSAHAVLPPQDEEAIFQQYAKMCTAEMQEKGKSTRPIEVLLSKKEKLSN